MSITARSVIVDALERLNRLAPGETPDADVLDVSLRRLNLLVDELSASGQFLFRSVLTSAAQTGHITLGSGSWAAILPGTDVVGCIVDDLPISRWTMAQYQANYLPAETGSPAYFAHDGHQTIYFWPVPDGQTVGLLTLAGVAEFADLSTSYTVPKGYANMLGAHLAVRLAPSLIGRLPPELLKAEKDSKPTSYVPAIIGAAGPRSNILNG